VVPAGGSAVITLSLLNGHRSLVVGQQDGSISVWFPVRPAGQDFQLTRIRDFPPQGGPIRALTPSPRDKGFVALDGAGGLGLYYSTSHRTLWVGRAPIEGPTAVFYAPKADAVFVSGPEHLAQLLIENPHPEVSLEALFSKVWYEGYEEPRYTWQSSSGTDDFEPKLSLTPLLFGTLKGTFYSLILAIPLAVFGAMYTSQFMHHSLKRFVKPAVEIMAALPSVVLGFIAGLWLAPRLDKAFPGLLLLILILPLMALLTGVAWRSLPPGVRGRFPAGSEVLAGIFFLAFGAWLAFQLGPVLENWAFAGRFQTWLLDTAGLGYDQRNAVVVGLAMGFAVIPIIFSVAEEAFSNVPQSLVAGSLALGASRWQTVAKVVLPTASAGIFSAVMIGFGRAVGETMIVLMATGNTPIMDWSPFNGFRTLSANIAVEIPEAPAGATLYRVLFLAGLLLFALTFAVNTVAEVVRQNLRRKYANL
jgi:phosphate transport system permease protein